MTWFRPRRPSGALVVAVIALIVALSGTAYAGVMLGKNSVGTRQLRNLAVTTAKIHNGAITARKLKKGLVVPHAAFANLAGQALSAGHANTASTASTATNANNADNATNAGHASSADSASNAAHASSADTAGSAAALTGVNIVRSPSTINPYGNTTYAEADCPAGQYVVGGGAWTGGYTGEAVNSSWPTRQQTNDPVPDAWGVWMSNQDVNSSDNQFYAYAICTSGSATSNFKGPH